MIRSWYFLFIPIVILVITVGVVLAHTANLNEQLEIANINNQKLQSALNNYTDTFGEVSFDRDLLSTGPWKLETKAFVASSLDEMTPLAVDIKANEQYSATAMITRPSEVDNYPPLLGFVMYVQVLDHNGDRIAGSWYHDTIRTNQTVYAGTYWSPKNTGTYTIEVLAWQSFTGTPLAEVFELDVHVTEQPE